EHGADADEQADDRQTGHRELSPDHDAEHDVDHAAQEQPAPPLEAVGEGRGGPEDAAHEEEARQQDRQGQPALEGLPSRRRPTTMPQVPESRARKNPLHSRHQKAPMASAMPPMRIRAPSTVTVASVVATGKPSRIVPSTISAMPRATSQIHL